MATFSMLDPAGATAPAIGTKYSNVTNKGLLVEVYVKGIGAVSATWTLWGTNGAGGKFAVANGTVSGTTEATDAFEVSINVGTVWIELTAITAGNTFSAFGNK